MTRRRRSNPLVAERQAPDAIACAFVVGVLGLGLLALLATASTCQGPGPALGAPVVRR